MSPPPSDSSSRDQKDFEDHICNLVGVVQRGAFEGPLVDEPGYIEHTACENGDGEVGVHLTDLVGLLRLGDEGTEEHALLGVDLAERVGHAMRHEQDIGKGIAVAVEIFVGEFDPRADGVLEGQVGLDEHLFVPDHLVDNRGVGITDEIVFVLEMFVDRPFGDAGLFGDGADRGGMDPLLGTKADGCFAQVDACVSAFWGRVFHSFTVGMRLFTF